MWRLIRNALRQAGEQNLPAAPTAAASDRDRTRALVAFGEALSSRAPWTVVLDGFPTGTPSRLGRELEIVLDHSGRSLRLVLLGHGTPAVDLHRFAAAGELVRVTAADLLMDADEITGVLRLGNAPHDAHTVSAVASHTLGWACGVRLAAMSLEGSTDLTMALHETDRAIDGYLAHEVLGRLTAPVRKLLVWTSVEQVVAPGAVLAGLGARGSTANDRMIDDTGLVERLSDGSLVCHPLLRAAARAELERGPTGRLLDRAPPARAVVCRPRSRPDGRRALPGRAGLGAGRCRPRGVPCRPPHRRLHRGRRGSRCRLPTRAAGRRAPAAGGRCPEPAGRAGRRGGARRGRVSERSTTSAARRLACAFVQLGIARLAGQAPEDADLIARSRGLLAESAVAAADGPRRTSSARLDAFAGAVEVSTGDLESALVTLSRGAERSSSDCAGQLAVLEAYRGDLGPRSGTRGSSSGMGRLGTPAGVAHARVALAWVSVDRGALREAQAFLDEAHAGPRASEPWLRVVHEVVRARLLIASGRPDEAIETTGRPAPDLGDQATGGWLAELVTSVAAEAFLAAGEPQQALAVVTVGLPTGSPERAVLTARRVS